MRAEEVLQLIDVEMRAIAGRTLRQIVEHVGQGTWSEAVLNVNFAAREAEILLPRAGGSPESLVPSPDLHPHLERLSQLRLLLKDPWPRMQITLGSDGSCNVKFSYD